jgi:hypothetical protein
LELVERVVLQQRQPELLAILALSQQLVEPNLLTAPDNPVVAVAVRDKVQQPVQVRQIKGLEAVQVRHSLILLAAAAAEQVALVVMVLVPLRVMAVQEFSVALQVVPWVELAAVVVVIT